MTFISKIRLPEGFDKDLKLLMASMTSRRISMGFLQVVRSIYFALLGFSYVEIGLLLSLATFISAIHHILFGFLSDRFGRKIFLILGGIFATLRLVIFALSSDFWMLALGQGIGAMGEGAGAGQPVVSGYIADKTDVRERPQIFSTLAVTNAFAASVGSIMASLPVYFQKVLNLNVVESHSLLFWIGSGTSLASLLIILPIRDIKPVKYEKKIVRKTSRKRSWGIIARFSLIRSTSGLGWGFIESLMPLYFFLKFGVGGEFLGPIYAGARMLSIFSYFFIPMVVERFGVTSSIMVSRFLTAILTIAFSQSNWLPLAVFLLVSLRIAILFAMPIRQSMATDIVNPEETATAIGVSNFARMSIRTIAPTAAGYMFQVINLTMPFLAGSFLLVINGLLFWTFFSSKKE